MNFKLYVGVLVLALMSTVAWAQTVSGTVTDENNQPFPGATVIVQGTDKGTTTDFEGKYSIVAKEGETLVFSYLGYAKQSILIGDNTTINIQMIVDNELEEVVVIGYGTTTKETFVGTATKVSSEDIEKKNTTNISQALAGEVAGVTIINSSGQPGSASGIRIRGFGSISGNRSPLYVVDGIPFNGSINSINKTDIESYTVLKDASATAIYGSRGANGVVLITTKKGKAGTSRIEISVNQGYNSRRLPEYQTITNQEQYVELGWEALKNAAIIDKIADPEKHASDNIFSGTGIHPSYNMWDADGADLIDPATGKFKSGIKRKYTPENWRDYLFNDTGIRTEANLRLSGGVEKTTYSTSFGFLEDKGYLINSSFKRQSTRIDLGHQVKEWLKGSLNLGYTHTNSSQAGQDSDATSAFWFATSIPSIYPIFLRDADGKLKEDTILGGNQYDFGDSGRGFGLGSNPVATTILDIDRTLGHEINGNTRLEASFLENFKFLVQYGIQYRNSSFDQRGNVFYGFSSATGGSIFKFKTGIFSNTFLQSISYKNTFDLHTVEAKLFHESQDYDFTFFSAYRTQLADPYSLELNNAVVNVSSSSYLLEYSIESYFGTLDYDYDEKYFASFSLRRDGSSRFLKNKWGNFYSMGASWLLSKEDFLSNSSWVDFLKLKASYGTTGDQAGAGLYSGYDLYSVNNLNNQPSFSFNTKGNPDLTWEASKQFQVGTEFEIFERFEAELDYYIKTTNDLLVPINVGPSLGYRSFTGNDGSLRNTGFEFNLTGHIIKTNDLKLKLNINGAIAENEILAMPIDPATGKGKIIDQSGIYGRSEGKSIFDHYMREFAGVNPQTGVSEWYVNYTDKNNNSTYDKGEEVSSLTEYRFENPMVTILEGKTTIYSDATQRYIGTSAIPDIQGAFHLDAEYKGVTLSAQFLYQFGGTGYDSQYANLMGNDSPGSENYHIDILNRWQKSGDITNVPRVSATKDLNVNSTSSRFLTSSDYISLNNVRLGYNFSERLSKKLFVEKISTWISGDNLWLNSKRDGYNPTTSETATSSIYNYAPLTTIVFGLKVQF